MYGPVTSPAHYRQTVRELRSKHRLSFEDMLRTYLRHKRSGRNGGAALRDWLDRYADVDGIPESGLEQMVARAIRTVLQTSVVVESGVA